MKKILSLCLCLLIIFNIFPIRTFAEEQNLEEIIRPQIEAFAKSIDQKNADGKAQDALISHGIKGNGKKLSVGKSHAITATIMNSELMKSCLTEACAVSLRTEKEFGIKKVYGVGLCRWPVNSKRAYYYYTFSYDPPAVDKSYGDNFTVFYDEKDYLMKIKSSKSEYFVDRSNGYDESLKWIAGGMNPRVVLSKKEVLEDKIIYDVNVRFLDTFNFDTDNSSTLEDLLGWVGMLLFEPFEWESKFSFQIEIPIEKPEENIVFGDSDGNGKVDVMDAYFARLVAAKLVIPTEEQLSFCDVDSDGKITAIDANIIRKFAAGIIKELPVS